MPEYVSPVKCTTGLNGVVEGANDNSEPHKYVLWRDPFSAAITTSQQHVR